MWKHFVVRACTPNEPFSNPEIAYSAWLRLRTSFPDLLSAVLMPNHLHLIVSDEESDAKISRKLSVWTNGISKRCQKQKLWQPTPPAASIPDQHHLLRQLRYVALNPCRKQLCSDPLAWYWSTYRELFGASADKPSNISQLAHAIGRSEKSENHFLVWFHSYVSSDPSVHVKGTRLPKPASPRDLCVESIGEILAACAGALRLPPQDLLIKREFRNLFVHLAVRQGWKDHVTLLAKLCNLSRGSIYSILQKSPPPGLSAAIVCLGDQRLRPGMENIEQIVK